MKVIDAINAVDNLKPNMYQMPEKIRWLSNLDLRIKNDIYDTHEYNEGETETDFDGYTEEDTEEELLVGAPYDEMYVLWLAAQIDFNNMEYDGFNNTNAMFNSVYSSYRNDYNQKHMPKTTVKRYF